MRACVQKHIKKESSGKTYDEFGKVKISPHQKAILVVMLFVGIVSSILSHIIVKHYQSSKIRNSFENIAKERVSVLKEHLENSLHALDWVAGLYNASQQVERSEFTKLVQPYLKLHTEVQALEWIPRVLDSQRQAYETAAKEDGFTDFRIVEKQNNETMVPASNREEYFPVYFIEPYDENKAFLGFDLGSNPMWFKTLKWSYENNKLAATEPPDLMQETNSRYDLMICKPVYHNMAIIDFSENRQNNLRGFVVLMLRMDSLLEKLIANFKPWNMSIHLYDISSSGDKHLLAEYSPFVRNNTNKALVSYEPCKAILQNTDLHFSTMLDVANKKWQIICAPAPFFIAKEKTASPLIAMMSGFGFTCILCLLTLIAFKRITEHRQAEQEKQKLQAQLRQTQKMEAIGTLAGGIAHDFNNILAALIGYADLVKDDIPEGTITHQNIEGVLTVANRATELVKQILTFCRKDEAKLVPMKINTVVAEALKMLRSSLPTTIEFRQDINCNSSIMADETQIHQVLINLGTNAAHAMSENGGLLEINLSDFDVDSDIVTRDGTLHRGSYVKLTVKDTGCGMSEEVVERIFEPFFTTKAVGKGTGLGLSVIHGIVENHNGIITVDTKPGEGTTFDIFFPCVKDKEIIETKDSELVYGQGEQILFVDDEKSLVDTTTKMLRHIGYKVIGETNSIEALKIFQKNPAKFDLVITDLTMPNMTGIELARELINIQPDIPIVLCTGFREKNNEKSAKAIGIKEVVTKPVNRKKISRIIQQLLIRKKQQHEICSCYR